MVYVFLADGFELIEALAPVDMLRRAKIGVMTVGIGGSVITASCGVSVTCDISDKAFRFKNVDAIVLPGGMPGTKNLEKSPVVLICACWFVTLIAFTGQLRMHL